MSEAHQVSALWVLTYAILCSPYHHHPTPNPHPTPTETSTGVILGIESEPEAKTNGLRAEDLLCVRKYTALLIFNGYQTSILSICPPALQKYSFYVKHISNSFCLVINDEPIIDPQTVE